MTVKELIDKLEELPGDSVIEVLDDYDGLLTTDIELYTGTSGHIDILPA